MHDTPPQLITTQDGSHSLWVPTLNETYHSTKGALQESLQVFIQQGLMARLACLSQPSLQILEVGLGTGLNALLTYLALKIQRIQVVYTGLEPAPIAKAQVQQLNYVTQLAQAPYHAGALEDLRAVFAQLHQGGAEGDCQLSDQFLLRKGQCRLETFASTPNTFDLVYYDAFAPSKQPEMWTPALLQKVHQLMQPRGMLVTYCAQGEFKRSLRQLGMRVEVLPGPPGKKEMVRAWKSA